MKKLSEGNKMFLSVMVIFAIYVITFIMFGDYERKYMMPIQETNDVHLVLFSVVVMIVLGVLLHRYSKRMDERISREQADKENKVRRELTQNIAHELKTPVSSILGYTETILQHPDMADGTRQQFIERTHSQAHRLASLLQDLSTLNRMDYASDKIHMEDINVNDIVDDIVRETALEFSKKHMTVNNNLPDGISIVGSQTLIYSIFRNLIDNAIKYSGDGTTVTISAREENDKWLFTFADNGVGIAQEHLSRIFERFYRVDKGRSRVLGGTGLGLSVVKNAVLMHGGTIKAQSAQQGGLCFKFSLKKINPVQAS